jgi:hypothetical protein
MPWYRVDGIETMVHMCGRKLPPACPERGCQRMTGYLCDFEVAPGRTCDQPICEKHASQIGKNRHHCPRHTTQLSLELSTERR